MLFTNYKDIPRVDVPETDIQGTAVIKVVQNLMGVWNDE
jgi:hypothetical protein